MKSAATKNLAYIGAGIGLTLFALFGLLYGSLIGGMIGLNISGAIMGSPVESGILQRMIVAIGMLSGILIAAVLCIGGCAAAGYMIGIAVDTEYWKKKKTEDDK